MEVTFFTGVITRVLSFGLTIHSLIDYTTAWGGGRHKEEMGMVGGGVGGGGWEGVSVKCISII